MTVLTHPVPSDFNDPERTTCTWRWEENRARWSITDDCLEVSGEIDQASYDVAREGFVHAMHERRVAVIDLRGVTFFGAAGVTLLTEFAFHQRAQVIGNPLIERVLRTVSCPHLLTDVVHPSDSDEERKPVAPTA